MSEKIANQKLYNCWGCDRFCYTSPDKSKSGECHARPPVAAGDTTAGGWPPIADGTASSAWCGAFFPATHKVPTIPVFPA